MKRKITLGPQFQGINGYLFIDCLIEENIIKKAEIRNGLNHRGIEKIAELKHFKDIISLVEKMNLEEVISNAVCFSSACEKIFGVEVPHSAAQIRAVLTELEKLLYIYNRFISIAKILEMDITAEILIKDRDYIYKLLKKISGTRFCFDYIRIGGVKAGFSNEIWFNINELVEYLRERFSVIEEIFIGSRSVLNALSGIGIITEKNKKTYSLSGLLSSLSISYRELIQAAGGESGIGLNEQDEVVNDSYSRLKLMFEEIRSCVNRIDFIKENFTKGAVSAESGDVYRFKKDKQVFFSIESPTGELFYSIHFANEMKPNRLFIKGGQSREILEKLIINSRVEDVDLIMNTSFISPLYWDK